MILLMIDEEYGYREWYAFYDEDTYQQMYDKFQLLMPELNCLVEVTKMFPEAIEGNPPEEVFEKHKEEGTVRYAHQHMADDSFMDPPILKLRNWI